MEKPAPRFPEDYEVIDPLDPVETRMGPFYAPKDAGDDPHLCFLVEPHHLNRSGVVHGGLLMTFADCALCALTVDNFDDERTVTITLNTDFTSYAELGDMVMMRGEVTRKTGSFTFVRGIATAGGRTILSASAVIKRSPRK